MWIMLNKAFLSIVDKAPDDRDLLVRARRKGEIEAVFPNAKVIAGGGTDYDYRAQIDRGLVAEAIAREIVSIGYPNFKDSVKDPERKGAYMDVWSAMMRYQLRTRRGRIQQSGLFYDPMPRAVRKPRVKQS